MPFISFIVPVYNIKKFLPACTESIFSQPFNDWEVILVDDRSTDGSEALCDRYAGEDGRVTVVHLPTNVGPGMARNHGLRRATGDYVFFLDGDDSLTAGGMAYLQEAIAKWGFPDMIHVGYTESFGRIDPNGAAGHPESSGTVTPVDDFLRPFLRRQGVGFRAWEFVLKRSMLLRKGLEFGAARVWEDNDFIMRSLFSSNRIGHYGGTLCQWRTRLSGTLTSAHSAWWDQIVKSAAEMLEFACRTSLSEVQKEWALRCVHSCLGEFEAIAGAISLSEIIKHADLFLPLENHMPVLEKYAVPKGLLWHIGKLGAGRGAAALCQERGAEARELLNGKAGRDLFGFPATRKCSRLLAVLGVNGYAFQGMLDNDPKKQGLMLDGRVILSPDIIPLCYENDDKLFVIICTSTKRTGAALAGQLSGYGLKEGKHFICTGAEED